MQAFEFYSPTQMVFGPGTEEQVGQLVAQYGGSRVLIVYGGGSAVKSGLLDRVQASLTSAGIPHESMGGVLPNPRLSLAEAGVAQAAAFQADFILAVGGGSVIDTAKAISLGATAPDQTLWKFWTRELPMSICLPVASILTIPAAGSESSTTSVLTNDETMVKRGLSSRLFLPKFAILNPELTLTLPPYQVACGVVDIMMHTLDRYFNPITTNELTDEIAEGLLRTAMRNGKLALEQPGNLHAMSELMWCGSLSHNDLTGLGGIKDFAPHQLGHELSAKFDVAHGASLSAMWDSWARYCVDTNPDRFAQYGVRVLGLEAEGKPPLELAVQAIEATAAFFTSIGMPTSITQLGVGVLDEDTLQDLAERCTFWGTRTIGSFRVLGREDILAIYRIANH